MNVFSWICGAKEIVNDTASNANGKPYHLIRIQRLLDKLPVHSQSTPENSNILKLLDQELSLRNDKFVKDSVYYQNSTNDECIFDSSGNSFIGAFLMAYNNHRDIILSPDDMWNMIMLMFSKYVNNNTEELREKLVSHKGQMKLQIKEYTTSAERSLEMEREWESGFFDQIFQQIRINTHDGICDTLQADFTTTTPFERIFSVATVMDSFQKYFTYSHSICSCGINNVRFMGTLEDWQRLRDKTAALAQFTQQKEGDFLTKYVTHLLPILDQFVATYQNKVDVSFWNRIVATEEHRIGSGDDVQTSIEGWLLHFLGS